MVARGRGRGRGAAQKRGGANSSASASPALTLKQKGQKNVTDQEGSSSSENRKEMTYKNKGGSRPTGDHISDKAEKEETMEVKAEDQEEFFEGDGEEIETPFELNEFCFGNIDIKEDGQDLGVEIERNVTLDKVASDEELEGDGYMDDDDMVLKEVDIDDDLESDIGKATKQKMAEEADSSVDKDKKDQAKENDQKPKAATGTTQTWKSDLDKLKYLSSIPNFFTGPCFDADSFRCRISMYPVAYFDLRKPEMLKFLACSRSLHYHFCQEKQERMLEVSVQKLGDVMPLTMLGVLASSCVEIDIEQRRRVDTCDSMDDVPCNAFSEFVRRLYFRARPRYIRLVLMKTDTRELRHESLEQKTLYIDNLPSSTGHRLLKALFPRAKGITILDNSDGKRSAQVLMSNSAMVYDHLVAFSHWNINGNDLELRMHNKSQSEAMRDIPQNLKLKPELLRKYMGRSEPDRVLAHKNKMAQQQSGKAENKADLIGQSDKESSMVKKGDEALLSNLSGETKESAEDKEKKEEGKSAMESKSTDTKKPTEDMRKREERWTGKETKTPTEDTRKREDRRPHVGWKRTETKKPVTDMRKREEIKPLMGWKGLETKNTENTRRREEGRPYMGWQDEREKLKEKERSLKTDRFQRMDSIAQEEQWKKSRVGGTFGHQSRPRDFDLKTNKHRMEVEHQQALELRRSQETALKEAKRFREEREMRRTRQENIGQAFIEQGRWHQTREQEPFLLAREDTMHRTKPSMHQQREHESGTVRFPQDEDRRRQPLEQRKRRREEPRRQEAEELGQFSSKRSRSDSSHWARTAGQAFEPMTEHHEQMDRRQQGHAGVVPMPGDEQPLHTLPKESADALKQRLKLEVLRQTQELQKNLALLGKIQSNPSAASLNETGGLELKSMEDNYPGVGRQLSGAGGAPRKSSTVAMRMQGGPQKPYSGLMNQQTAYQEPYNAAVNLPYQQPYNDANQQSFMGDTSRSKDVTTNFGSLYNKEEKPWHGDNYGNSKGNEKGKYNRWQQDQGKAQRSNNREKQQSQTDRSLHGQQGYWGQQQGHQGYGGRQQDQVQSVGQFQNKTQFGSRYEAEQALGGGHEAQSFGGRHKAKPAFEGGHKAQLAASGGHKAQPAFSGGHKVQPTFGSHPDQMRNQNMYEGQQQQYGEYDQQQYEEYDQQQYGEYDQQQYGEYNQQQYGEYDQQQYGEYNQQQYGVGFAQQQYIDKSQGQSQWFGGRALSQPQYGGRFGGHQQ